MTNLIFLISNEFIALFFGGIKSTTYVDLLIYLYSYEEKNNRIYIFHSGLMNHFNPYISGDFLHIFHSGLMNYFNPFISGDFLHIFCSELMNYFNPFISGDFLHIGYFEV